MQNTPAFDIALRKKKKDAFLLETEEEVSTQAAHPIMEAREQPTTATTETTTPPTTETTTPPTTITTATATTPPWASVDFVSLLERRASWIPKHAKVKKQDDDGERAVRARGGLISFPFSVSFFFLLLFF